MAVLEIALVFISTSADLIIIIIIIVLFPVIINILCLKFMHFAHMLF